LKWGGEGMREGIEREGLNLKAVKYDQLKNLSRIADGKYLTKRYWCRGMSVLIDKRKLPINFASFIDYVKALFTALIKKLNL
jgi:hypothetical protein